MTGIIAGAAVAAIGTKITGAAAADAPAQSNAPSVISPKSTGTPTPIPTPNPIAVLLDDAFGIQAFNVES